VLISVRGLGRSWACSGDLSGAVFRDAIQKLFGENQLVVLKLNRRDLPVLAEEVTR
jgi:hypothetical protein